MVLGTEQRRHRRHRCSGSAEVFLTAESAACAGSVVNLSVTGCLLILKEPQRLVRDARVELTFTVNHLPFRVLGEVKAIRSDKEFGLYFPALSQRIRNRLEDLMKELAESKSTNGIELKTILEESQTLRS